MVQFNLLPDVKIEYIKTQAKMRIIIMICIVVSTALLAIFVLLFLNARVLQPAHMNRVTSDINSDVKKIRDTQDIDKILTIQKQLGSLPGLHDSKVISSRLPGYLVQVSPQTTKFTDIETDFTASTMTIKGTSPDLATVNKYVDTLKFTNYKVAGENGKEGKAFSEVVLDKFAVQDKPPKPEEKTTFEIKFKFDPELFKRQKVKDITEDKAVLLIIPNIISTRSETEKPTDLFTKPQEQKKEEDR